MDSIFDIVEEYPGIGKAALTLLVRDSFGVSCIIFAHEKDEQQIGTGPRIEEFTTKRFTYCRTPYYYS